MSLYKKALELHQKYGVIDAHMDLASEIYNRLQNGEKNVIKTYYLDNWRKAGMKIVISSLFIETEFLPQQALQLGLNQVNGLRKEIEALDDSLQLILSNKDIETVMTSDKIGILIAFEGLEPILNDLTLIDTFYDLGVRGAGLVWSRRNYVAEGSYFGDTELATSGGLSPFGIEVIKKLEARNIFVDVSHLNDEGFGDVMTYSSKPILASHSNCRSLNDIRRNLTDAQIKRIANTGGVIGINNIRPIICQDNEADYIIKLCDHIDHMVSIAGDDCVGFGFDICAGLEKTSYRYGNREEEIVDALASHEDAILITEELLKRGYLEERCRKIIISNMLEYLKGLLE